MSIELGSAIHEICQKYGGDRTRMMDIVRDVQEAFGCVSGEAMNLIAKEAKSHRVEVESVVSFYAFLSEKPKGKIVIRLCDDIIDRLQGCEAVAKAISAELGIGFGETTADGNITLEFTPCIGMCDQAPAVMVNDVVVTKLTPDTARDMVKSIKTNMDPTALINTYGDGNNAHELVKAMVSSNIRKRGEVVFGTYTSGDGLKKAIAMSPAEVIRDIKTARLRGRGGAGFPTGMKWDFTRGAPGTDKVIICNADEGEPGTFKDRVILTECADQLFEGMTVGGYAIGASTGILYLRAEYAYLRAFLENILAARRNAGLLGNAICGKNDFNFDIRIQMGAGAYVCGEETSLISSCEGLRGDPKNRPPFPAQKGYLGNPTAVNNVETYCCVTKILDMGPGWFAQMGSKGSPGTKLLSVSGDCKSPGVYEIPFGTTLAEFLKMCGGEDAKAVQMGGPSGQMVGQSEYGREICYDDLATGGSVMVFGPQRNLLEVVEYFMEFFIEESCGYCTPCRVGNVLMKNCLQKIMQGKGEPSDLPYLEELGNSIKIASRCGLGQTSPNPVLTTLKYFRSDYEALLHENTDGMQPGFDLAAAVGSSEEIVGRASIHK